MLTPVRKHAIDDIIRTLVLKYKMAAKNSFYTSRLFTTNLSRDLIDKHIIKYAYEIKLKEVKEYLKSLPEAHTDFYNIFADNVHDPYSNISTETIILILSGRDYNDIINYFNN